MNAERKYKYIYPHINYNKTQPLHRFSLTIDKKRYNLFSRHDLESVIKFRNEYLQKNHPERWAKVKEEEQCLS